MVLDKILNDDTPQRDQFTELSKRRNKLLKLLSNSNEDDLDKYLQTLDLIEDRMTNFIEHARLNANQVKESEYYNEVRSCIKLEKTDEYSLEEFNRFFSFFDEDNKEEIKNVKSKIRKRK